ncbi:MAG: WXG100 family type VII secretion target [Oscillospiraceae bacterium]
MTGIIRVSSEQLISTAGEFQSAGSLIQTLTADMMNKVASLSASWEGDASQAYLTKFKGLETDINKLISMVNEHVSDLQAMAEVYASAETANNDDANALRTGVIS